MTKIKAARVRKTKTEVLASIDFNMENAASAGIVDHGSQISSWISSEQAEDQLLDEVTNELVLEDTAPTLLLTDQREISVEAEAVAELELIEEISEIADTAPIDAPTTLEAQLAAVDPDAVDEMVVSIANEIDDRAAFEANKNPDNENIQKTIKKVRAQMVTKRAAKLLLAANLTPEFMNRSVHEGAAYNVYALGKLADVIYGVTDGVISNAINIAVMKSLFNFHKAETPFDANMARAAASDKIRVTSMKLRELLVRHTVSAGTAPTQASSTMQALTTLGVVRSSGDHRNPTYNVIDSPLSRKLMEKLAA
jgi:hypothetical protein